MTAATDLSEATSQVADNIARIRADIAKSAQAAGRDPRSVTLIGVSKVQPDDRIEAALAAGQRVFGENRVQEAKQRWAARRETYPDLQLHLIGPLQTNKVKDAVALFDVIHTVDRPKLAKALADEMRAQSRRLPCLVEVNTGEEAQKHGILPGDVDAFVAACKEDYALQIVGLMAIPPVDDEPSPHFALLADMTKRLRLPWLSMGMSADYEVAIRFGATHVRVGTALFGSRQKPADAKPA